MTEQLVQTILEFLVTKGGFESYIKEMEEMLPKIKDILAKGEVPTNKEFPVFMLSLLGLLTLNFGDHEKGDVTNLLVGDFKKKDDGFEQIYYIAFKKRMNVVFEKKEDDSKMNPE